MKNHFDQQDPLALATRNARILRWFDAQSEVTKINVRMIYARELQCPLCEITEYLILPEDLDFIWDHWQEEIAKFHDVS